MTKEAPIESAAKYRHTVNEIINAPYLADFSGGELGISPGRLRQVSSTIFRAYFKRMEHFDILKDYQNLVPDKKNSLDFNAMEKLVEDQGLVGLLVALRNPDRAKLIGEIEEDLRKIQKGDPEKKEELEQGTIAEREKYQFLFKLVDGWDESIKRYGLHVAATHEIADKESYSARWLFLENHAEEWKVKRWKEEKAIFDEQLANLRRLQRELAEKTDSSELTPPHHFPGT